MEQQRLAALAEGQVAQLVQNDQIRAQQTRRDAPGLPAVNNSGRVG
jgi:hypothetical protein